MAMAAGALRGSPLGRVTDFSRTAARQLWPFGAVCMGCIKPNVLFSLPIFVFFLLNSDQYVQLPLLSPLASLLRMLPFSSPQWPG